MWFKETGVFTKPRNLNEISAQSAFGGEVRVVVELPPGIRLEDVEIVLKGRGEDPIR